MPDDQAAPGVEDGFQTDSTSVEEQPTTETEEQSYEQTDDSTSEEVSEESEEDQRMTQLEEDNAALQSQVDEFNRTFTQQRQAEAEQRRQEEQPPARDFKQYGDQAPAVEELVKLIREVTQEEMNPVSSQLESLTSAQKQNVNIAAAIAKHPGVSEKAIKAMYDDENITTEDIIAQALAGKLKVKKPAVQTKKNAQRKKGANTGTQQGGTPKNKGLGWKYDEKNPEHVNMTGPEIMRKSRENYHE